MERESHAQSLEVAAVTQIQPKSQVSKSKVFFLVFLMLWPWFWVSYGLFVLRDFRLTIALYELFCCALPVLLLFRTGNIRLWPLNMSPLSVILGVIGSNLFVLVGFKALHGANIDWAVFGTHIQAINMAPNAEFWRYGIYLIFFNPLFEEVFWRGTIYREWKSFVSPWQANLISSFFFGAWHWVILQYFCPPLWAIAQAVLVMIGGAIFAYQYEKTGSLAAPIIIHGLGADLPLLFMVHTAILHSAALGG